MEWWMFLLLFIAGLILLMSLGMPVAFAFMIVNLVASLALMGPVGPELMTRSMFQTLASFTLAPVPFFIFMGEIFFHSGIINRAMNALDIWLGKVPARQSLLAAGGGTLFAALSGSTIANTAMLGNLLVPQMRERGYSTEMSVGPILGVGGLAMIIPPSGLAVLLGSVAQISIGKILIGGILPGLLVAFLYGSYIIGRALIQPELTPDEDVESISLREKIVTFLRDIVPLFAIIFVVIGFIILGIATPTESSALGAAACLLLTIYYRRFTYQVVRDSLAGTLEVTGMVFLILAASVGYSQLLSYSGASREMVQIVDGMDVAPVVILIAIQVVVLILGTFMDQASMIMLVAPLAMPIVDRIGIDPIWFGIVLLLSLEIGFTSPPFGLLNFVMKGVVEEVGMEEIWMAGLPFIICDLIAMALLLTFPIIVTWLPSFL